MDFNQKLEFIEEVKRHRELYDKNNQFFHDCHKKAEIWNIIGEKLNITEPKKKWASLRDKYVRLKRLGEINPVEIESYPEEKWNLYQSLSFLNNFCRHRKRSSYAFESNQSQSNTSNNTEFFEEQNTKKIKLTNLNKLQSPKPDHFEFAELQNNNDDDDENQSIFDDEVENDYMNYSNSVSNEEGITTKRIKNEISENEKYSMEAFDNSKNDNSILNNETENILFIKMIGKKLELLSSKNRNKIQIQILQLVNRELDKCNM